MPGLHPLMPMRLWACACRIMAGLLASMATSCATVSGTRTIAAPSGYVIWCDCATPGDRERIASAVRQRGGSVLYVYDHLAGLAVAAPRDGDPAAFRRSVEAVPGVRAVVAGGVQQTQATP